MAGAVEVCPSALAIRRVRSKRYAVSPGAKFAGSTRRHLARGRCPKLWNSRPISPNDRPPLKRRATLFQRPRQMLRRFLSKSSSLCVAAPSSLSTWGRRSPASGRRWPMGAGQGAVVGAGGGLQVVPPHQKQSCCPVATPTPRPTHRTTRSRLSQCASVMLSSHTIIRLPTSPATPRSITTVPGTASPPGIR
jgi:hypothetical protein